jgi:hypothetical protein
LEPLKKGVIEKMAYLAEFWIILESDLVERAPHKIFDEIDLKLLQRILNIVP